MNAVTKWMIRWAPAVALCSVLLLGHALATACPLCKEAIATDATDADIAAANGMARGYAWSIVVMMSAPFMVTAAIAGLMISAYRRQTRSAANGPVDPGT